MWTFGIYIRTFCVDLCVRLPTSCMRILAKWLITSPSPPASWSKLLSRMQLVGLFKDAGCDRLAPPRDAYSMRLSAHRSTCFPGQHSWEWHLARLIIAVTATRSSVKSVNDGPHPLLDNVTQSLESQSSKVRWQEDVSFLGRCHVFRPPPVFPSKDYIELNGLF